MSLFHVARTASEKVKEVPNYAGLAPQASPFPARDTRLANATKVFEKNVPNSYFGLPVLKGSW